MTTTLRIARAPGYTGLDLHAAMVRRDRRDRGEAP